MLFLKTCNFDARIWFGNSSTHFLFSFSTLLMLSILKEIVCLKKIKNESHTEVHFLKALLANYCCKFYC